MTYPATVFNDVENIEGTGDGQARWNGFLADIFISVPHMCLICGFQASSSFFPFLFVLVRYTDIRVESTPATLPNATGVVIDLEHKVCC